MPEITTLDDAKRVVNEAFAAQLIKRLPPPSSLPEPKTDPTKTPPTDEEVQTSLDTAFDTLQLSAASASDLFNGANLAQALSEQANSDAAHDYSRALAQSAQTMLDAEPNVPADEILTADVCEALVESVKQMAFRDCERLGVESFHDLHSPDAYRALTEGQDPSDSQRGIMSDRVAAEAQATFLRSLSAETGVSPKDIDDDARGSEPTQCGHPDLGLPNESWDEDLAKGARRAAALSKRPDSEIGLRGEDFLEVDDAAVADDFERSYRETMEKLEVEQQKPDDDTPPISGFRRHEDPYAKEAAVDRARASLEHGRHLYPKNMPESRRQEVAEWTRIIREADKESSE